MGNKQAAETEQEPEDFRRNLRRVLAKSHRAIEREINILKR